MGSDVTVPAGQAIELEITSAEENVTFTIDYDSQTKPSKIELPTSTYIDITSFAVYDAAYPGGNFITDGLLNGTVYVRTTVSDPFGYDDITGLDLNITPTVGIVSASSVATSGCTRTYEYVWNTPATGGTYNLEATAKEGFENTVTAVENISFDISPIEVEPCSGNAFNSPGAPATCTYTYDSGSWDIVPPSSIGSDESVCILADLNSTNFNAIDGTIYIAPGVTYTGQINRLGTAVIEGTLDLTNAPNTPSTLIYIASTGTINFQGNIDPSGASIIHNAGSFNVNGNIQFSGSSYIVIYEDAYFGVQGDVGLSGSAGITNCGFLEIVTGDLNTSGGSNLQNECIFLRTQ